MGKLLFIFQDVWHRPVLDLPNILAVAEDDICVKSQEQLHPNNKHNSPYQHSVLQIAITIAD
jgi:hypothetical protein